MEFFGAFLLQVFPLYILIALGYIGGRHLELNLKSIARINLFILLPFVTFGAILNINFNPSFILLPLILYGISTAIAFGCFHTMRFFQKGNMANLIGMGNANGNAIYFGLPVVLYIFGPEGLGLYLFMNMGAQINNITLGYYFGARNENSIAGSLKKVMEFPAVHATWLGIVFNVFGYKLDGVAFEYWEYASGAIVILGMMMIGIALGKISSLQLDWKLILTFCFTKFVVWPGIIAGFIFIDSHYLGLFDAEIYKLMILLSVMPLMGNIVAYSAEYNLYPEKAATAVLVTTILAAFIIAFVAQQFLL